MVETHLRGGRLEAQRLQLLKAGWRSTHGPGQPSAGASSGDLLAEEADEDDVGAGGHHGTLGGVMVALRSHLTACDLDIASMGAFGEDLAVVQFKVAEAPFSPSSWRCQHLGQQGKAQGLSCSHSELAGCVVGLC